MSQSIMGSIYDFKKYARTANPQPYAGGAPPAPGVAKPPVVGMPTPVWSGTTPQPPQPVSPVTGQKKATKAKGGGGGAAKPAGGTWSPELSNLNKGFLNYDWFKGSPYASLISGAAGGLLSPLSMPVGMSPVEKRTQLNQLSSGIAGQTRALTDQARGAMGGRGFRAGESGQADSVLGGIAREGLKSYGTGATNIALEEMKRKYEEGMGLQGLNLSRATAGAGMLGDLDTSNLNRLGVGLQAGGFGAGLEQFEKQRQAAAAAQAAAGSRFRQQMDWEKERFGKEFGYGQERDAMQMLMSLYGQEGQNQESAYAPYYEAQRNAYGYRG